VEPSALPIYWSVVPAQRLSFTTSHVVVDEVFGLALAVCILVALILGATAWQRSTRLRDNVWIPRRKLRAGIILIEGVAHPVEEERHAAETDAVFPPFVEVTIHQRADVRRGKKGEYWVWQETSRSLTERPFLLRTEAGDSIRVEPSGALELADKLEPGPQSFGIERTRIARIIPGERIWVRGRLELGAIGSEGPYRGAQGAPTTLRPSGKEPLLISSQPVWKEDRDRALVHFGFGSLLIALLVLCQTLFFGDFRTLRSRGVVSDAVINDARSWVTQVKGRYIKHYGFSFDWLVDGKRYAGNDEVGPLAYQSYNLGAHIPIVYDPIHPKTMMPGRRDELGINNALCVVTGSMYFMALLFWYTTWKLRRPWWRQKKLVNTERVGF
jgi:hypothetical protein